MSPPIEWAAWEPEEWVRARGASECVESAHFAVRWGAGPGSEAAKKTAEAACVWLEQCWAHLCHDSSPDFFVLPYSSGGWCADGRSPRRKMNVYIGKNLAPHPGTGWAHQGTHVERGVDAVRHTLANPEGRLHHSYLALAQGAAKSERTVCHEFAHCLQMHTGGHIDSKLVGYQWEAHAEYCVHLLRPTDPQWAPHVKAFLETAHLPIDCTNAHDDGTAGRQYVVWPFYCFLDSRFGRGFVHRLWHADRQQRQEHGRGSRDLLSNLASGYARDETETGSDGPETAAAFLSRLFAEFALSSLTLKWGWAAEQNAALRKAASFLLPTRLTRLRPGRIVPGGGAWRPDSLRPLKRFGSHTFRLEPSAGARRLRVRAVPATGTSAFEFYVSVVCCEVDTGREILVSGPVQGTSGEDDGGEGRATDAWVAVDVLSRRDVAYLVAVSAGSQCFVPCEWGTKPSDLKTSAYMLLLEGCEPHRDCAMPRVAHAPAALTLRAPEQGALAVPTGLANLRYIYIYIYRYIYIYIYIDS